MPADPALHALAAAIGRGFGPVRLAELLASAVDTAQTMTRAAAGSIALVDGDELEFRHATGPGADAVLGLRIPLGRGIAGWAVSAGQLVALDDVQGDPRFAADVAEELGYLPRSIVAVPLDTDDEILGVLELLDATRGELPLDELAALGRQTALSIRLAHAFTDFGRTLLEAAAQGTDLASALRAQAAAAPDDEVTSFAAALATFGQLGPPEREAADALLRVFLDYARTRDQ
jgi:GAF domain-containing protein